MTDHTPTTEYVPTQYGGITESAEFGHAHDDGMVRLTVRLDPHERVSINPERVTIMSPEALEAHDRKIAAKALREAAEDLDTVYFGPDQDTPFSTGAKYKWGAAQSAKRLRERADRIEQGGQS